MLNNSNIEQLCGYKPNRRATEKYVGSLPLPEFAAAAPALMRQRERDTVLYPALFSLHPSWRRGSQGIGDCVSWGYELACTLLKAIQIVSLGRPEMWHAEVATESIYGGSRVEARGRKTGGWSDGSYGAAAAKWVHEWGVLLRQNYSQQTGNSDHDLSSYSSKRAKDWGNWGCGGQSDKDALDLVAREHPVQTVSLVATFDEAAAAIQNGFPVPVCSGQGFSSARDKEGFCAPQGSWAHCMCFIGVRYGARPGLLCANSWGRSVKGPFWPAEAPEAITWCAWWVDADVCNRMLSGRDSFALSNFKGFPARKLDFLNAAQSWN
jgi:hypothetical protein